MNSSTEPNITNTKTDFSLPTFGGGLLYFLLLIAGISGNVLTTIAWCRDFLPKKPLFLYVHNIAIAQLLFFVTTIISAPVVATGKWFYGNFACKLWRFLLETSFCVCLLLLTALGHLHYQVISSIILPSVNLTRCKKLIYVLWFFSMVRSSPIFSIYSVRTIGGRQQCVNDAVWSREALLAYFVIKFIISILPFSYFLWSYGSVLCALKSKQKSRNSTETTEEIDLESQIRQAQKKKENQKLTVLVALMIVAFYLCWMPGMRMQILQFFGFYVDSVAVRVFGLVTILSSDLSPVLLALCNKELRLAYRGLIFSRCQ